MVSKFKVISKIFSDKGSIFLCTIYIKMITFITTILRPINFYFINGKIGVKIFYVILFGISLNCLMAFIIPRPWER